MEQKQKIKIIIDDTEFEAEISNEELAKLRGKASKKISGYERATQGESCYTVHFDGVITKMTENFDDGETAAFNAANYVTDLELARNNARADLLLRELRRFSAMNRKNDLNWADHFEPKYTITYNHKTDRLAKTSYCYLHPVGIPLFDTAKSADDAIEEFKDELKWYFTEYRNKF